MPLKGLPMAVRHCCILLQKCCGQKRWKSFWFREMWFVLSSTKRIASLLGVRISEWIIFISAISFANFKRKKACRRLYPSRVLRPQPNKKSLLISAIISKGNWDRIWNCSHPHLPEKTFTILSYMQNRSKTSTTLCGI